MPHIICENHGPNFGLRKQIFFKAKNCFFLILTSRKRCKNQNQANFMKDFSLLVFKAQKGVFRWNTISCAFEWRSLASGSKSAYRCDSYFYRNRMKLASFHYVHFFLILSTNIQVTEKVPNAFASSNAPSLSRVKVPPNPIFSTLLPRVTFCETFSAMISLLLAFEFFQISNYDEDFLVHCLSWSNLVKLNSEFARACIKP